MILRERGLIKAERELAAMERVQLSTVIPLDHADLACCSLSGVLLCSATVYPCIELTFASSSSRIDISVPEQQRNYENNKTTAH
jgi:hypothetical protein